MIRNIALVFFCAIPWALAQEPRPSPTPSIVYKAHNPDAIKNYKTNPRIVRGMVNQLVLAVTGKSDIASAWASLVSPGDKIGIKISADGGKLFATRRDVVNAIVDGLVEAGHKRGDIIVWDRSLSAMKEAGYSRADGYQARGIEPGEGYDSRATFTAPVLGKLIWGDLDYQPNKGKMPEVSETENTSNVSHFARILSRDVTKVINVPVMSSSETNAIAGCIYNMTIPNIDNWRRFATARTFGPASLAQIYADPTVQKKVVLNIMDGLIAQYAGGPQSQPNWAVHHATLYAGVDPVAIDSMALKQLEEGRRRANLPSVGRAAAYLQIAAEIGLGNAAPDRIEIKNVGR